MPTYSWTNTSAVTTDATFTIYVSACNNSIDTSSYNNQLGNVYWSNVVDPVEAQADALARHKPEAKARAQELLLEHLTPAQRETFKKNGWFMVEGGKSGRKYRIRDNDALVANIDVIEGEKVKHRLCGHARISQMPLHDHLLAQKVMLENAEDDFLKIANRHAA